MTMLPHKSRSGRLCLLLFFVLAAGSARAQESFKETIKQQLVKDWQRAKAYTDEFIKVMPADKFSFKPEARAMTFGEQLLHLAKYNYNLGAAGTGKISPVGKTDLQLKAARLSKDSIAYYVDASYDFVISNLQQMDAAKVEEKQGDMTRFLTLEKAFEHQTHHRGGMAVYLRMAGVVPPHEMLF